LGDGLFDSPLLAEGDAKIAMSLDGGGIDAQGFGILDGGPRCVATLKEGVAEVVMGKEVVAGASEGVCPEGEAIAPVSGLMRGGKEEGTKDGRTDARHGKAPAGARAGPMGSGPDAGDAKAYLGKVGVAIGVCMGADLKYADDRDEHAEVPEPADEEPGLAAVGEGGGGG